MYFEDLNVGDSFTTASQPITQDEIVAFATEWDPQSFHIDIEGSKQSIFGSLIASGLHTLAITHRLFNRLQLLGPQALAGLGYRNIKFSAPVFPNDILHAIVTIVEKRVSAKEDRGVVTFQVRTLTDKDREVLSFTSDILGRRRE